MIISLHSHGEGVYLCVCAGWDMMMMCMVKRALTSCHTHVTDTHDVGCLRIVGNAIAIPGMLYSEGCIDVSYWSQKT